LTNKANQRLPMRFSESAAGDHRSCIISSELRVYELQVGVEQDADDVIAVSSWRPDEIESGNPND